MSRSPSITRNAEPEPSRTEAMSPQAVADYIQAMSAELAGMAERAQLRLLCYLLNMVRLEAETLAAPPASRPKLPRRAKTQARPPVQPDSATGSR